MTPTQQPDPRDPPRRDPTIETFLTTDPLDVAAAYAAVVHPEAGGVGLFVGVVRDHHEGASVTGLEYEAWEDRAAAALRSVAEDVLQDHPGVRCVYAGHRLGALSVGEASVVVAASAPHRGEAIAAAQALIDRLKASVPIWKKESLAAGGHRWPGAEPDAEATDPRS